MAEFLSSRSIDGLSDGACDKRVGSDSLVFANVGVKEMELAVTSAGPEVGSSPIVKASVG